MVASNTCDPQGVENRAFRPLSRARFIYSTRRPDIVSLLKLLLYRSPILSHRVSVAGLSNVVGSSDDQGGAVDG